MEKINIDRKEIRMRIEPTSIDSLIVGATLAAIETHQDITRLTDLVNGVTARYYQAGEFNHQDALLLTDELDIGKELRIPVGSQPFTSVQIINRPLMWFNDVMGEVKYGRTDTYYKTDYLPDEPTKN